MSMLAIVTFDLHGAQSKEYKRVKAALTRLKLDKKIKSTKSGKLNNLPANTFAARFTGKWNQRQADQLRDHLCDHVTTRLNRLALHATLFVAVGDDWAWGKRTVP